METNKTPTAEQFFKTDYKGDIVEFAKEFAKLHVEAALKKASDNAQTKWVEYTDNDYVIDEDSILNAYPLTNIK